MDEGQADQDRLSVRESAQQPAASHGSVVERTTPAVADGDRG
ncbi:hypothetical protein ABZ929_05630 [Streptomyces physcomitrii]